MAVAAFLNKEEQKLDEIDAMMEESAYEAGRLEKKVKAILKKEGGAVGLKPLVDAAKELGATKKDLMGILKKMKEVKTHKDGDIINTDGLNETGQEKSEKNYSNYFKKMDKNRLEELVKAALMGPMNETSTDKYDDNPALKGKQSELPDGLKKAIIKKSGGKVNETAKIKDYPGQIKNNIKANVKSVKTFADEILRHIKTVAAEEPQGDQYVDNPKIKMAIKNLQSVAGDKEDEKTLPESFDSLAKDLDKQKGVDKEYAGKIAGKIANIKRKGGGKGPTAKQKKRMAETILKELREEKLKLTPAEQDILNDIKGSLNEGMFDNVLEKVKKYSRKGLITVGLLLALSNMGFSAEQQEKINSIVKTEMPASEKGEIDRMHKISVVTTALQQYKRGKKLDKLDDFLKQDLEAIKNGPEDVDQVVDIFDSHQDALKDYVSFMF